ncbi:regulatory protein RecX [Chloroflexota bacterium]
MMVNTITSIEIGKLRNAEQFGYALDKALRYLSPRPRSEVEIKTRLCRYGFTAETIKQVLIKLRRQGLADDAAFARFWRENRERFRPRSRRLLALELRQKGVPQETITEAIADVDDEVNAYQAAQKKANALAALDCRSFGKILGAFLQRRGFGYEVIDHTISRLWQEKVDL